jgi:hypothetical protein
MRELRTATLQLVIQGLCTTSQDDVQKASCGSGECLPTIVQLEAGKIYGRDTDESFYNADDVLVYVLLDIAWWWTAKACLGVAGHDLRILNVCSFLRRAPDVRCHVIEKGFSR